MDTYTKSIFVLVLCISLFACTTTIPETDTTPPRLRFELRIPSTETIVITSEDEFEDILINLRTDSRNAFIFSSADTGGLRMLQMQFPDYIELTGVASDFTIREATILSKIMEWNGDRSNPVNGMVATGYLIVPSRSELGGDSDAIQLFAADFGGRSGTPNNTHKVISIQFEDGLPVGVISRF